MKQSKGYEAAELNPTVIDKIQEFEKTLSKDLNCNIVIVAYKEKNESK
jgi:hypothetical protein